MATRRKPSEMLVERLRGEGYAIADDYTFNRCRPGHLQRATGAWSWYIQSGGGCVGSPDSVAVCLGAKKLECDQNGTIYAE
jgi:hypothetical protein